MSYDLTLPTILPFQNDKLLKPDLAPPPPQSSALTMCPNVKVYNFQ